MTLHLIFIVGLNKLIIIIPSAKTLLREFKKGGPKK